MGLGGLTGTHTHTGRKRMFPPSCPRGSNSIEDIMEPITASSHPMTGPHGLQSGHLMHERSSLAKRGLRTPPVGVPDREGSSSNPDQRPGRLRERQAQAVWLLVSRDQPSESSGPGTGQQPVKMWQPGSPGGSLPLAPVLSLCSAQAPGDSSRALVPRARMGRKSSRREP